MTATATDTPTIELRGISKSFGPVQALVDVDFYAYPGEVMALVGDNGAGKSTLIKTIAGIHPPDSGEFWFEGQHVHDPRAEGRRRRSGSRSSTRISRSATTSTSSRTCTSGASCVDRFRRLDEATMESRTGETLRSLAVTTIRSIRQNIASLSGGQRQSVAVAKAVMWNSKLVILDEPTAALGVAQTQQVLELVKRLAAPGALGRPHLAQPQRRLRGRRPHHRAAPGPPRRRVPDRRHQPAADRRGDHRRNAGQRLEGSGMTIDAEADAGSGEFVPPPATLGGAIARAGAECAPATSAACRSSSRSS